MVGAFLLGASIWGSTVKSRESSVWLTQPFVFLFYLFLLKVLFKKKIGVHRRIARYCSELPCAHHLDPATVNV